MRRLGVSGPAGRIVIVIALGAALIVLGRYFVYLASPRSYGWFAYAPLDASSKVPRQGPGAGVRVLIWLGMIALWTAASLLVLKPSRRPTEPS